MQQSRVCATDKQLEYHAEVVSSVVVDGTAGDGAGLGAFGVAPSPAPSPATLAGIAAK